jgi:RNA polymerase primary sigma factor
VPGGGFKVEEFSARTIDEALAEASEKLGLPVQDLTYEIREAGSSGFLGIGSKPATIAVRISTPRTAVSSDQSNNDTHGIMPGEGRRSSTEKSSMGDGTEKVEGYFYSLDQASTVLETDNVGVKALASEGPLRAKFINGRLWFPAKDFEDFVVREYGSGRLVHGPDPYPATKVRQRNFQAGGGRGGAPPATRSDSAVPPKVAPSGPTGDRRVVMEAAQRLRMSMNEIRRRVAAGELVYVPDQRRLLEADPKASEVVDEAALVARAEKPSASTDDRQIETGKSAQDEYLTVPQAAAELGESVTDVLGRIGKRELKWERISGRVMVRTQAVLKIKAGQTLSPQSSQPTEQDTVSGRAEAKIGESEHATFAGGTIEELQERATALENELGVLRRELEEEKLRRQQRDEWIADLLSKLEESDSGRERVDEFLASVGKAASSKAHPPKRAQRASGLALYPWQREALDWWRKRGYRGVVEAVTGAGKTRLAIAAIAQQLRRGEPTVVVVPTKDLLHQWKRELERWLVGELGRPVAVGLIGANRRDTLDNYDLLVSTAQSGSRHALLTRGKKGLLVADEVHHYGARSWSRVLQDGFDRRLGLTATYEREDSGIDKFLDPYFGGGTFPVGYARALADDVIAPFKIAFVAVRFSSAERRRYEEHDEKASRYRRKLVRGYGLTEEPFGEFMSEVNHLASGGEGEATGLARGYLNAFSKRRQTLAGAQEKFERVADLSAAVRKAERSILFAQTKEAAAKAVDQLTGRGINGAVLTSSMDMSERKEVFAAFEDGEHELVAAPRLLDEGVDVPAADLAIVLASSRSRRQMVQRMGRVVRKKQDGRLARLAVLYVMGTSEDPEVAHEDFLYLVTEVARDIVYFGPNAKPEQICNYLNDWKA